MTRSPCPTDELLGRYVGAQLDDAAAVEAHLAECPACVARLDALSVVDGDALVAALRAGPAEAHSEFEREVEPYLHRPTAAEPELPVGAELAGYRLLAPIGAGGMGRVYRARHARLEQDVAVKVVAPGVDSEQVRTRFEAERHALALMDHPNIARVIDGGVSADGRPFFVMELVAGVPITTYCDGKRLPVRERLGLFVQVCQAVQHAHQKGIIHRDLKPSNVLVAEYDGRPVPKVIDFGVAKAVGPRPAGKTEFGMVVGTPEYMSPEQAGLDSLDVDTRADLYALGVLLYELLTGDTPLARRRLREAPLLDVLRLVREEEPAAPSTRLFASDETMADVAAARAAAPAGLRRQLRGDLDWIVLKTLDKDRARRYESATALADDIERHLRDEPVSAGPPSAGYRLRKFARRNQVTVIAASVVLIALISGATAAIVGLVYAQRARRDADIAANAAMTDRDVAEAVRIFFQDDLLRQVSARRQLQAGFVPQPDLKVRELLDRSSRRIAGRFDSHPLVEAAIRHTMGDAYREIGVYPTSHEHLARAVELYNAGAGAEDSRTLDAETSFVALQLAEGLPGGAVATAERIYDARRRALGDDDVRTLEAATLLARTLTGVGPAQHERANALYQVTLDRQRNLFGDGSPEMLATMSHQAMLWSSMYGPKRAEPVLKGIHARLLNDRGPKDIETLHAARSLGRIYMALLRLDDAIRVLSESLPILTEALGTEHADALATRLLLASARAIRAGGKTGWAELADVIAAMARTFGPDHPTTLIAQHDFAALQLQFGMLHPQGGDRERAEKLLTMTLAAQQRVQGKEHPDTLTTAADLGAACVYLKQYDRAEKLLNETLAAQRRLHGDDDGRTLNTAGSLADLMLAKGNVVEAHRLLRDTVAARRKGPPNKRNLTELRNLGMMEQRRGKSAEAAEAFAEWLERATNVEVDLDPYRVAEIQSGLGFNRLKQGKLTEAETALRESLVTYAKVPGTWEEHYMRALLGHCLVEQKKYADAEPLLLAGHDELEKLGSKLTVDSRAALDAARRFLINLYVKKGEPQKAAEWRQKRKPAGGS